MNILHMNKIRFEMYLYALAYYNSNHSTSQNIKMAMAIISWNHTYL